jgi:Trk K+ transport system NAD-binding subunit
MRPIPSTAVLGCGAWGQNLVRNLVELGSLVAACDETPAARARVAAPRW